MSTARFGDTLLVITLTRRLELDGAEESRAAMVPVKYVDFSNQVIATQGFGSAFYTAAAIQIIFQKGPFFLKAEIKDIGKMCAKKSSHPVPHLCP